MDRGPCAETCQATKTETSKTCRKWLTPTNHQLTHTHIEPSSIDNYKMKYSASQNYFPCQCRTPPLQYKYQSLILYVHCKHWCTSVDVWLPLLFHHRLPVTNWEERERANFNMYLCPCLSVVAFLCVYLSKYHWLYLCNIPVTNQEGRDRANFRQRLSGTIYIWLTLITDPIW